jgi:hypothetical protein
MAEEQREKIYSMVSELDGDSLLDPNAQPNANTIYHFYNDGQITQQKGGWAYLQRSEFDIKYPIAKQLNLDTSKFKYIRVANNVEYGYIIASFENAMLIRKEMEKLAELL